LRWSGIVAPNDEQDVTAPMIAHNVPADERPAPPGYLTLADVRSAAQRLDGVAHRTPVITSRTLDERVGRRLYLKPEMLQRVGAFKFRGAFNAVAMLDEASRARGVCSASSGNHAQALALACALHDVHATILMPRDTPPLKRSATEGYGAEVISFDRYSEDREALLPALAHERGAEIIHPYDDPRVMAGQGTLALELIGQAGELDAIVVPVGGGGLISGCATVVRALCPGARIVGVEPEAGDDVARSLADGARCEIAVAPTIADGQQTPAPGERTWPVIQALVDEVVTVTDDEILTTMRTGCERLKLVVEPSGATALAAVLHGHVTAEAQRVGVVLSGGNADPVVFARALAAG
jgi:threonine dehydratase